MEVYSDLHRLGGKRQKPSMAFTILTLLPTLSSLARDRGFPTCLRWPLWTTGRPVPSVLRKALEGLGWIFDNQLWRGQRSTSWKSTMKQRFPDIQHRKWKFIRLKITHPSGNKPSAQTAPVLSTSCGWVFRCFTVYYLLYVSDRGRCKYSWPEITSKNSSFLITIVLVSMWNFL